VNPLNVDSSEFDPTLLLNTMRNYCEHPVVAVNRFHVWVEEIKKNWGCLTNGLSRTERIMTLSIWHKLAANSCLIKWVGKAVFSTAFLRS